MSSDSDDWETADIPDGAFQRVDVAAIEAKEKEARDRAATEALARDREAAEATAKAEEKRTLDTRPVLLVNLTALDPEVHNRADKHAVSDIARASALRKKIEAAYDTYAGDAAMKAAGTVRASTRGTYVAALGSLRDEEAGCTFAPPLRQLEIMIFVNLLWETSSRMPPPPSRICETPLPSRPLPTQHESRTPRSLYPHIPHAPRPRAPDRSRRAAPPRLPRPRESRADSRRPGTSRASPLLAPVAERAACRRRR